MSDRHLSQRLPKRTRGFSWGRSPCADGGVAYRLFRRDHTGRLHWSEVHYRLDTMPRVLIARELRGIRRLLRDRVDTVDLVAMGVT